MKKFVTGILCVSLAAGLMAGCSSEPKETEAPVAIGGQETVHNNEASGEGAGEAQTTDANYQPTMYDFVYNGVVVVPGTTPGDEIDALGQHEIFEAVSCAYQGTDYTYSYSDFVIVSTPSPEGVDTIVAIDVLSDAIITQEGAYIGMTESEIIDIYGEADEVLAGGLIYREGHKSLSFFIIDGTVNAISYGYTIG